MLCCYWENLQMLFLLQPLFCPTHLHAFFFCPTFDRVFCPSPLPATAPALALPHGVSHAGRHDYNGRIRSVICALFDLGLSLLLFIARLLISLFFNARCIFLSRLFPRHCIYKNIDRVGKFYFLFSTRACTLHVHCDQSTIMRRY